MVLKRLLTAVLVLGVFGGVLALWASQRTSGQTPATLPTVDVYKTPTCGCCSKWVDHLRHGGFTVTAKDVSQEELDRLKDKHGLPAALRSCHTALVGGYLIEGHIPAAEVKRLLQERPKVAGLAVPGMPLGSPGMEVSGVTPHPYNVLTFDKQGNTKIFATIKP